MMNPIFKTSLLLCLLVILVSCQPSGKIELFNGENLDNWSFYTDDPGTEAGDLFWVEDGLLHTTGKPNGYIRTREAYNNFKLHVEWRWEGDPTNSGVLLHVQGPDMIWPLCLECQLMHGHAGDVVCIGKGSGITVGDSAYLVPSEENRYIVIGKNREDSEYPAGEWNSYDITLQDGDIEVVVNGILQQTGTGMTLSGGNIALQSEGSPMQFRNVTLEEL